MWRIAADPWYDVDITEKNHSEIHVEDINLKAILLPYHKRNLHLHLAIQQLVNQAVA